MVRRSRLGNHIRNPSNLSGVDNWSKTQVAQHRQSRDSGRQGILGGHLNTGSAVATGSLPSLGLATGRQDDGTTSTSGLSYLGRTPSIAIEGDDKIKGANPRWQPQERPRD